MQTWKRQATKARMSKPIYFMQRLPLLDAEELVFERDTSPTRKTGL